MTEKQILEAMRTYMRRLAVALNNLERASADVTHERVNVRRMQTALRSVRARKGRKTRSR
jgi:hypothetical protein